MIVIRIPGNQGLSINQPAAADEGDENYPQLWKPFGKPVTLQTNNTSDWIENMVPMFRFIEALKSYKRRFQSLRRSEPVHVPVQHVTLLPASKMWCDSHIMVFALFKALSNSNNSDRGGEFRKYDWKSVRYIRGDEITQKESKKYAVIDVADIVSIVGLIQKIEFNKNNKPAATNWFYIISPSNPFKSNMSLNAGKISEL
ncbi:hypothetical protein [Parasitella parasitica]|uniref:Uncharacterized protein n=1 Tax=Parasitella parasitica TaxID=35722 RepID=A0A0B7NQN7_9FUNG|nr:hypothetical protein [Parasitella parasitica]